MSLLLGSNPHLFETEKLLMTAKKQDLNSEQITGRDPEEKGKEPGKAQVRFEVFGEEMVEKIVRMSGNSGRVYLPPEWVGKQVKVVRIS
jgi:putative transposon-encoded protein